MGDDESNNSCDDLESVLRDPSAQPCDLRLQYLREITDNFSSGREIGRGGFGVVYKGLLPNGEMIAVKNLLSTSEVQERQFKNEVDNLMRVRHQNIVRLVGYCYETWHAYIEYNGVHVFAEKPKMLLCFEYMPNGSLERYISDQSCGLDWCKRYKIIKGICYGLHYLHKEREINASIIHLDLKPANILLDEHMVAKIADFGLSKLFIDAKIETCATSLAGSYGYMAPEYLYKRIISTEADIYSLGVIIIEMITGHRINPFNDVTSSQEFLEPVLKNWRSRLEATPRYTSLELDCQQIKCSLEIGLRCVKLNRMERPTTTEIVEILNQWESRNCHAFHEEKLPTDKESSSNNNVMEFTQEGNGSELMAQVNCYIRRFTKGDIERMTNNYGTCLGRDAFGEVYKGVLDDGSMVAVKIFIYNADEVFVKDFVTRCQIIHRNIERILGYCLEENALTLVIEYVGNGDLSDALHHRNIPIPMEVRLGIAIECAEALAYMHSYCYVLVIHGVIKPVNILLDGSFRAKLSNFGISSTLASMDKALYVKHIIGSIGYMDPLFVRDGLLSAKCDVYSFGAVLLELITRKKASTVVDDINVISAFTNALARGGRGLREMFDAEIATKNNMKLLEGVAKVAGECLAMELDKRPDMKEVAECLLMLRRGFRSGSRMASS